MGREGDQVNGDRKGRRKTGSECGILGSPSLFVNWRKSGCRRCPAPARGAAVVAWAATTSILFTESEGTLLWPEAQPHRRCINAHLLLDGLVSFPQPNYIVVHRDPHDVSVSLWNHHASYNQEITAALSIAALDDAHA